jgi:hypothetical protein
MMKYHVTGTAISGLLLKLCLFTIVLGQSAFAESLSVRNSSGTVALPWNEVTGILDSVNIRRKGSPKLRVSARIKGLGPMTIWIYSGSLKRRSWQSTFVGAGGVTVDDSELGLLVGDFSLRRGRTQETGSVAASVVRRVSKSSLDLMLPLPSRASGRLRHVRIKVVGGSSGAARLRISKVPNLMLHGRSCGTESLARPLSAASSSHSHPVHSHRAARQISAREVGIQSVRIVELSTDADFEFFSRYGADANNEIALIVQAANVFYVRDLGMSLSITAQRSLTAGGGSLLATDPEVLLDQYVSYLFTTPHSPVGDNAHLFTGKEIDGSTVGIAWLGTVCTFPDFSNGLTQDLSPSLNHIVFAHELGHNLAADHDTSSPPSIMFPSVSTSQLVFSTASQTAIGGHIAGAGGSCLASGEVSTPTPAPTSTPVQTATATPTRTATSTPSPTATINPDIPTAIPTVAPTATARPLRTITVTARKQGSTRTIRAQIATTQGAVVSGATLRFLRKSGRSFRFVTSLRSSVIGFATLRTNRPGIYQVQSVQIDGTLLSSRAVPVR